MAKVKPEMPPSGYQEEYVLCSGVRSGLKREFAFALKAQAEMLLVSPVGRTRSGKILHSSASSRRASAKRRKKLDGAISPSKKLRILRESEDAEPLGTEMAVEVAMSGSDVAEDEAVPKNELLRETCDTLQIESMSTPEMPLSIQMDVGGTPDASILPGERSVEKAFQPEHLEGESAPEDIPCSQAGSLRKSPLGSHAEERTPSERVSSILVYSRPVLKLSQRNQVEEEPSTGKVPPIQVYARPVSKMAKRNHVIEGASVKKVPSIQVYGRAVMKMLRSDHVKDGASTRKASSIQVYARPLIKVPQTDHVEKVASVKQISSTQVDESAEKIPLTNCVDERASTRDVSSAQVETCLSVNNSALTHIRGGASTEELPLQVESCPVVNVSTEDISSMQVSRGPVEKISRTDDAEEAALVEEISSIRVEGSSSENISSMLAERGSGVEMSYVNHDAEKGMPTDNIQLDTSSVMNLSLRNFVEEGASVEQADKSPVNDIPCANHFEEAASLEKIPSMQADPSPVVNISQTNHVEEEEIFHTNCCASGLSEEIVLNVSSMDHPGGGSSEKFSSVQEDRMSAVKISLSEGTAAVQLDAIRTMDMSPMVHSDAIEKGVHQNNEQRIVAEEPSRRFTRSLLKTDEKEESLPNVEESSALTAEASPAVCSASDNSKESKDSEVKLRVTPKKKMELKMSKKIALSKLPSNIRDLLATGLLEGLPVKYLIHSNDRQRGLRGVIKGGGILCFCSSCKGLSVVSAYHFELHAGSRKKHPSDFICLENGNTIHDVLRMCSSAPLDMLESTIQSAISSEGGNILNFEKCRDSSARLHIQRSASPTSPNPCLEPVSTSRPSRSIFSAKSCESSSSQKGIRGRMTTKDLRLHKLVFMDDILPDGTEVAYYSRGQRLLDGYIKNSGIFCRCCNTVVSPSLFEAHAGCSSRRKPYLNIYTSNGVSLHELSVSLSKGKKFSTSESDDLCRICGDGGDLLLCDICPRAFHKECVGMTSIPTGDWYCPSCQNMHIKDKSVVNNENAIAAGRVAGVDPIEEIFKRCIRIAKTPEADMGGCVLCRCHDFCRTGFGPRTVLLCDQCEREFHVGCLKEHNLGDLKELPEGLWFCSSDCDRIHETLQKLLLSEQEDLPRCPTDVIKKKEQDDQVSGGEDKPEIRWRILSGKSASPESRSFLSKALSIFYESFDPIIDFATRKDLIPAMVYGWDLRDQDFGGMFCVVLTVNSSVVSAAILRVLGCEIAELPLVATSREYQGKGYFQSLFSCIEAFLDSLKVKHLVLPAAEEAEAIWTKKFGFTKISFDQLNEYMKGIRTMIFEGTSLLHKEVSGPPPLLPETVG